MDAPRNSDGVAVDEVHELAQLELAIRSKGSDAAKVAQAHLLRWLRTHIGDADHSRSISELIVEGATGASTRSVIPVVLRSLSGGVLPDPCFTGEAARAIVTMCERGTPELYNLLRVDPKGQSYEKFKAVEAAHQTVCGLLSPLAARFSDTDSALKSRNGVLGALNHSSVRAYGAPFDAQQIKVLVEVVYFKLKQIAAAGPSLLIDVEECKRAVGDGRRLVDENGSFIALDYLNPFLDSVDLAVENFLRSSRERFTTSISPRFNASLQKRYPLHEAGREVHVSIPFKNAGPGMATDVKVSGAVDGELVYFVNPSIHLGNVMPGDFSVVADLLILDRADRCDLTILLEWGEIGGVVAHTAAYEVALLAQATNIDWGSKEYWNPYSTEPAEGTNFVGRLDKVKSLAGKLLRSPMESFFITGQKRVGKTSLALACIDFAKVNSADFTIFDSNNLWGSFAHEVPRASLAALGRSIEALIKNSVPALRTTTECNFDGSLADLVRLCNLAADVSPRSRFVVVIDEFDEIHQELYLHGNLAETFFANLRALSRCKNFCLVLVGGENMPYVMERQGQKLNNFAGINLSYYDRDKEWIDFKMMVQAPTIGVVSWHDDAVAEVFNVANGNPFFAKILCSAALDIAIQERDADISADEVRHAGEAKISLLGSNAFAHLWQDGIPKPLSEREPDVLLRARVLVALARCLRRGDVATAPNIYQARGAIGLTEADVGAVLNELVRRHVMHEQDGRYEIQLPIFEKWLVDVGVGQLAADTLMAELASVSLAEEAAATVRSDEIANLVRRWPTYRGMHVGSDDVRAWLQQVDSAKDQRLLFEILARVRFLNEAKVREMLEHSIAFLQPLPPFVITRKSDRRRNIVVTYIDGEGKSGQKYASIFAEETSISGECIFPPGDFERRFKKHLASGESVDVVVVVDDLVGTGRSLSENLGRFVQAHEGLIPESLPIKVISLFSTVQGQAKVLNAIRGMSKTNVDFRPCEVLGEDVMAFPDGLGWWSSRDDFDRAKTLCNDLGRRIYKQNPLGYGGSGLLVVLPTNTPNNSLPILHSQSRAGVAAWRPLFPRLTH